MSLEYPMLAPHTLVAEHNDLHAELVRATKLPGRLGELATAVSRAMEAHFQKEEELAMPPLGLLGPVAEGRMPGDPESLIRTAARLEAELPRMLEDHREIVKAVDRLIDVALEENRFEVADFGERLKHHAQLEEEILYPAALLLGQYVRLRLQSR